MHIFEHVGLAVSDLDKSIDFYTSVFGLEVLRKTSTNAYLHLGDDLLELMQASSLRPEPLPDTVEEWRAEMVRHRGLNHIGFRVENLEETIDALESRGGKVVVPPFEFRPEIEFVAEVESDKLLRAAAPRDGAGWRIAVFADPDGTMLELVER